MKVLVAVKRVVDFNVKVQVKSDRTGVTAAKIIVSGGHALGSAEKFNEVITPLADKLGAAL